MDSTLKYNFINKLLSDTKDKNIIWKQLEPPRSQIMERLFIAKNFSIPATNMYSATLDGVGFLYLYKCDTNYAHLIVHGNESQFYESMYEEDNDELNTMLLRLFNIIDDISPLKIKRSIEESIKGYLNVH